jgi:hypothetical protein
VLIVVLLLLLVSLKITAKCKYGYLNAIKIMGQSDASTGRYRSARGLAFFSVVVQHSFQVTASGRCSFSGHGQ